MPRVAAAIVVVSILVAAALGLVLPLPLLQQITTESGPIERTTVVLYVAAIAAVCMARKRSFDRLAIAATVVILLSCIAREISLRKLLIAAAGEDFCCTRALVWSVLGLLALLLAASVLWLAIRYRFALYDGLRRRSPIVLTLSILIVALALSQFFDSLAKIVASLGGTVGARANLLAKAIEEVLEMILPVLVILAAWQAKDRARPTVEPDADSRITGPLS